MITDHREPLDVIVIGAGQAGLAVGYHLTRRHANVLLLDAGPEIGHSWRARWDSLQLFSPAEYDSLPGWGFPAPAGTHPGKDDVAAYLCAYAAHFALPIRLNTPVMQLQRDADGVFTVGTPTGVLSARQVVVATGPFQAPRIPGVAEQLSPLVQQIHTADYRNAAEFPSDARVLVVGAANSGLQVGAELSERCTVTVARGTTPTELPQRIAGRDLFFWLTKSGFFTVPTSSRIGRRLRARGDLIIGTRTSTLSRQGVTFRPRLTGFAGCTARFADGTASDVDVVVWATGYRSDYSWLWIPGVVGVDGIVRHNAGVTDVPGLYFLGLPWQTGRGSALLGFVGDDASALATHMAAAAAADRMPVQQR